MTRKPHLLLPLFLVFFLLHLASSVNQQPKVFIVYLGGHSGNLTAQQIQNNHHSFILSVKESEETARESLLYSYKNSMNGFAAILSEQEAVKISEMEGVISVFSSEGRSSPHTTRSWDFIEDLERFDGYEKNLIAEKANYGNDIIIGMLDTGIWPESKSFSDKGMGPVPNRWKGICEEGEAFNSSNCNRKIIGARAYLKGYESSNGKLNTTYAFRSPRDHDGHGSHTASTAAGRPVSASFLSSFAAGTAVGGAPLARLAIYKVCWPIPGPTPNLKNTCSGVDMLAAIDDAVADGVDVLSISLGESGGDLKFVTDSIAMGTLHAVKRGVVAVCSAGNNGPAAATVANLAPWVITVGASSIDRDFDAPVVIGNGVSIMGQSVTTYHQDQMKSIPLIYAGDAEVPSTPKNVSGRCNPNSLESGKVKGKAVLCLRGRGSRSVKGMEVKRAGGVAVILGNTKKDGDEMELDAHVLPATAVSSRDFIQILNYIHSDVKPTVTSIGRPTTVLGVNGAPAMATFSSRGPNNMEPNLLKPDITAPGLNILAAWSDASSPTKLQDDNRSVKYNIMSGTSMSCPHVSAVAALLKSIYPHWTSAAIRSAIITTATVNNAQGQPIVDDAGGLAGPMAYGSGHLQPNHASDPGLIYDASYADYMLFMCANAKVEIDPSFPCPKSPPSTSDLNYPSLTVTIPSNCSDIITINRVVTNVGLGPVRYEVSVLEPLGFSVEVQPKILQFKTQGDKKSFQIMISVKPNMDIGHISMVSGSFTWSDGTHYVRSTMIVNIA